MGGAVHAQRRITVSIVHSIFLSGVETESYTGDKPDDRHNAAKRVEVVETGKNELNHA